MGEGRKEIEESMKKARQLQSRRKSAKEPSMSAKEPCISAKEPCISAIQRQDNSTQGGDQTQNIWISRFGRFSSTLLSDGDSAHSNEYLIQILRTPEKT